MRQTARVAKGARSEPDDIAESVLREEAAAIIAAADRLDHSGFARAVELVRNCKGKVLTTGAGTSGIIARKIAATLTSTGTPSLFLHPSDALHGGLGVVQSDDVVIAISNSGETGEILVTLPYLRHRGRGPDRARRQHLVHARPRGRRRARRRGRATRPDP